MMTVFRGGEVHAPEPLGITDVLVVGDVIARVGKEVADFAALKLPFEEVDAGGCLLVPGFIDVHSHLVGTGGEQGFASRTSEVTFDEIVGAGVTTVVGCLGTDQTTRHLSTLLGRVRQLQRQGIHALMYTGSFHVPGPTLTGAVQDDLILIPEIIGVGELAIADVRATEPSAPELARLASDALVGGLLGEKAGVVHFHVGPGKRRLSLLREVIERFEVPARHLYPTHVERSVELLDEAIALARQGSYVDMDSIEPLGEWVRKYFERGGDPSHLTLSSDAHAPKGFETKLRDELFALVEEQGFSLHQMLQLATSNSAAALKLPRKGRLSPGMDADLLVLDRDPLRIREVWARGKPLLRGGRVMPPCTESFTVQ
jgi:beta-aspartyl-dipeptidase (metallo-type)